MAVQSVQAIINGQTYNLQLNSQNGKWEATITAPAKSSYTLEDHYYPITIKVTDDAGNVTTVDCTHETLGETLKLIVKEKVVPVSTITYPTASAYITSNKPEIRWTVTDDDSGVNPDTIGITIDSGDRITGNGINKTKTAEGYQCSYIPSEALSDGSHNVKVDASDYDGNAASQKSVTFTIDTVPPTLNVASPEDEAITNKQACTVQGTTNDVTSSPVKVTVKLNNGTAENVTVQSDGAFSKSLTLISGENTIVVTATDSAGKATTVERKVTLDTGAPVIHSISLSKNPVEAGKTFTISVEVTDE